MHSTKLRQVGGSVMLAVPRALLDVLNLTVGADVGLAIENGRLVMEPAVAPHFTLDALLAECDPTATVSDEDAAWLGGPAVGRESV
jgi:antitoxin ChpS